MAKVLVLAIGVLIGAFSSSVAVPVSTTSPSRIRFTIGANVMHIPYYRNMAIDRSHPQVVRAAVLVQGTNRNAATAYDNLLQAAVVAGVVDSTAILVAPHFLIEEDVAFLGLTPDVLYWSDSGWKQGDLSLDTVAHPRPVRMSAFSAMDSILYRLASLNPNLESIVVGGHSAGGQFVQRYAASNTIEQVLSG